MLRMVPAATSRCVGTIAVLIPALVVFRTQQINHGADISPADEKGKYIGRTCHWKECRPGQRRSCDALNCGRRHYLHDDLNTVALSEEAMRMALELWPVLEKRDGLPSDLARVLGKL